MPDLTIQQLTFPPLMRVSEFCRLVGVGETVVRECIHATGTTKSGWPALAIKRLPNNRIRITSAAATDWVNRLQDA